MSIIKNDWQEREQERLQKCILAGQAICTGVQGMALQLGTR